LALHVGTGCPPYVYDVTLNNIRGPAT
jgi:hypothetical protein